MLAAPGLFWVLSVPCGFGLFLLGIVILAFPQQVLAILRGRWLEAGVGNGPEELPERRFARRLLGLPFVVAGILYFSYFFFGFFEPR